jgi:hypothetical protein
MNFVGPTMLAVYDTKGQCIHRHTFADGWSNGHSLSLDFSESSQGLYQLRVLNPSYSWFGRVLIIR